MNHAQLLVELINAFSQIIEKELVVLEMDAIHVMEEKVQEAFFLLQEAFHSDLVFAENGYYEKSIASAITTMLRDKRVRAILLNRASKYKWLRYYLAIASDIVEQGWLPSDEDIISSWVPTSGTFVSTVTAEGTEIECVEFGGKEGQTRALYRDLSMATAVLYFVSAAEENWEDYSYNHYVNALNIATATVSKRIVNTSKEKSDSTCRSAKSLLFAHFRAVCNTVARKGKCAQSYI